MMIIERLVGNCPFCNKPNCFGNISTNDNLLVRGCNECNKTLTLPLPRIRKIIIYIDQFFFSSAFRDKDTRFVRAAQKISELSSLHLLIAPYSSLHEDETFQWTGYNGKTHEELMDFIKHTSRGHKFKPYYDIQHEQLIKSFEAFLNRETPICAANTNFPFIDNIHCWDDYYWIDIKGNYGDTERLRKLKQQATNGLIGKFKQWRSSQSSFPEDVAEENKVAAEAYIDDYLRYAFRIQGGDFNAVVDSPIDSQLICKLIDYIPMEISPEDGMKIVFDFFYSEYFAVAPYQYISSRILAHLRWRVKNGQYKNSEKSKKKLKGFFFDVYHVGTYAPYCDAIFVDKPMETLICNNNFNLEKEFKTKVFSLNNLESFLEWLESVKTNISNAHKHGLKLLYPPST